VPPEKNERLGGAIPPTHFPHWPNKITVYFNEKIEKKGKDDK